MQEARAAFSPAAISRAAGETLFSYLETDVQSISELGKS